MTQQHLKELVSQHDDLDVRFVDAIDTKGEEKDNFYSKSNLL